MAPLVWLITGSTSGIGEATVAEIVQRGDRVIAAGRQVEKRLGHLKNTDLQLLEVDISARFAEIQDRITDAWEVFGRIDVLFNNAGMSAMKSAEEADEKFVNGMFQVNLFGHMRATQAILPLFRKQGHGRIAFTSSSTLWAPLPFMSHYAASKAALSAYVESLDKEVRRMGIRCVAIECGGFPTNLGQPRDASAPAFGSNRPAIEEYMTLFGALVGKFATNPMVHMPGDLSKAAARIVDIVKQEGKAVGKSWAVRVALGSDGMGSAKQRCEEQLKLAETWSGLSCSTDRGDQEPTAVQEMFEFTTVLED